MPPLASLRCAFVLIHVILFSPKFAGVHNCRWVFLVTLQSELRTLQHQW